jgi:hypothetical protein
VTIRSPRRALFVPLACALLLPCAAQAQRWSTPAQRVLLSGRTGAEVRARSLAHADSVRATAPLDAGESWHWAGISHWRTGHPDSAAAAFRAAFALREMPDDVFDLAEALIATRRAADADSACRMILALPPDEAGAGTRITRLWRAWARARTGDAAQVREALDEAQRDLISPGSTPALRMHWGRRFAPLLLESQADAWPLLAPLAVQSRGLDAALLRQAREAAAGHLVGQTFDAFLATGIARADSLESAAVRALGGRPLAVRGTDGFALRAWLFPARAARAPLVVLLTAPSPAASPWPAADSLVLQLRRDGCAMVLLDPRGSRGSVAAGCALPDDWAGHEEALAAAAGHDLERAVTAALATGAIDPRRIAVGAVGSGAMSAALAARADRRVGAVVFVDASLSPVDRGPFVATLEAAGTPAFFQTGSASVEDGWVVDLVVGMLPSRQSRVAESSAPGSGLALFRAGPAEARRLSGWLRDSWSKPRATPPSRRP